MRLFLSVAVFALVMASVYYATRTHFSGITSFEDALYFSICTTTSSGHTGQGPKTDIGRAITASHMVVVFASVFNLTVLKGSSLVFFGANMAVIGGFAAAYKHLTPASWADSVYHSVASHTLVGHGSNAAHGRAARAVSIAQMLLVFVVLFGSDRNGLFDVIGSLFHKRAPKNSMSPHLYR